LPAGYDLSQAKAAYLNGFLRIDVPVAQRSLKSTKVPIAEGNSSLL
jgi:HSP20 family molecular chaperone IbpA